MLNATIAQVENCFWRRLHKADNMMYYWPVNIDSPVPVTSNPVTWDITSHFIRFSRAIHELERWDPKQASGLSMQQLKALLFLIQSEGSTIKEVAGALSLSEARASRLADELTCSGHVVSDRNPADRRQVRLRATPLGAEKARLVFGKRTRALECALEGLTDEEIDTFLAVFDRILAQLEDLAQRAAAACEGTSAS